MLTDIKSLIQSLQNPFRDWNWYVRVKIDGDERIQSLQNPFRDWNIPLLRVKYLAELDSKPPKPF